jgi:hypothetical protein
MFFGDRGSMHVCVNKLIESASRPLNDFDDNDNHNLDDWMLSMTCVQEFKKNLSMIKGRPSTYLSGVQAQWRFKFHLSYFEFEYMKHRTMKGMRKSRVKICHLWYSWELTHFERHDSHTNTWVHPLLQDPPGDPAVWRMTRPLLDDPTASPEIHC